MKPTAKISTNANQLAWWAKDAVVYFITAGNPVIAVKIGVTTWGTVTRRLATLQSSNHEHLVLGGVIPFRGMPQPMKNAEDMERELHERFRDWARTHKGERGHEWFTADATLLEYIRCHAAAPEAFGFPRQSRKTL